MNHCLKVARNPVIVEVEESIAQRSSEQLIVMSANLVSSLLHFPNVC